MKLPKRYQNAVDFAHMCRYEKIEPRAMAELALLSQRVFAAVCRETYATDYSADPARERFQTVAELAGLKVDFSNPYPSCTRNGREVRLCTL